MDTLISTLIGATISSVILSWTLGIFSMVMRHKNFKMNQSEHEYSRRFKEREFNINTKIDSGTDAELDKFVSDCVNEYILINYSHTKTYLNADECDKIFKEVVDMIKHRLTPAMFDKMSLYYNKEEIGSIIVYKAYLNVMKFIMERNDRVNFTK